MNLSLLDYLVNQSIKSIKFFLLTLFPDEQTLGGRMRGILEREQGVTVISMYYFYSLSKSKFNKMYNKKRSYP